MRGELKHSVGSDELAAALGLSHHGFVKQITHVAPVTQAAEGSLCFSSKELLSFPVGAVIISVGFCEDEGATVLVAEQARLFFARALTWLDAHVGFNWPSDPPQVHESVTVGVGCMIGNGVNVGAHTIIGNHVTIEAGTQIGERCIIKSGAVIGEPGFGFERDEVGLPVRLIHLGRVVLGNDVEVGSLTTVCRGTLSDTILEDHVKVDDHVHVAHNCVLRRGSIITACAELSGGVEVGEFAWIGPNASVIQKRKIGEGALVGIAANVTKDVLGGQVVVGNPAKELKS